MDTKKMLLLGEIFQDGMTIQREKPIRIWGNSAKAQNLEVLLEREVILKISLEEGSFTLELPPQAAAENVTLTFRNEDAEEIQLRNVDIGEIWIVGGQSNMEFPLLCDREGDEMIAAADDPHFRYYEVGKYAFDGERKEALKDGSRWNKWRRFTPELCSHFSAVAVYCALKLRKELQVPIAVVGCAWGGTSASAWIDEKILRADPELCVYTQDYDRLTARLDYEKYIKRDRKNRAFMGNPKNAEGADRTMKNEVTAPLRFPARQLVRLLVESQKKNMGPHSENRPGGLYRTMQQKIAGFTARGVLFYQGESDEHHAELYGKLFMTLIENWRSDWGEDLPFLFVQLAPWGEWMAQDGRNYPVLREEQQKVEDRVEGAYMVSIMDAGSQFDIHPKVKRPVGERLAAMALEEVYGASNADAHAPRIGEIIRDAQKLTLCFEHADDGLDAQGAIDGLFRLVQNGRIVPYESVVQGNAVILVCPDLTDGEAELSFAYEPYLVMNLKNAQGLPARPMAPRTV